MYSSQRNTIQNVVKNKRADIEAFYLHTSRAGAGPLMRFLSGVYGSTLRTEFNTPPPQHAFESEEIRWRVDWVSRVVPNSGRSYATNFFVNHDDIGPTSGPVRFISLVRDPLARIAGEFLEFRRNVEARECSDPDILSIASDIIRFSDAMLRNNFLLRYFVRRDLCDPINPDAYQDARAAIANIDVVGVHTNPTRFCRQVLSLDIFSGNDRLDQKNAFISEMSSVFWADGDAFVEQLPAWTRSELAKRNELDRLLYQWIEKDRPQ